MGRAKPLNGTVGITKHKVQELKAVKNIEVSYHKVQPVLMFM